MAKKETKKSDQTEVLENPEVLAEKLVPGEDFLKNNSKIVVGIFALAVVLIGGILFFQYNTQQQNEKAQAEMSCSTFDEKNSYKIFNEHLKMHNRAF